MQEDLLPGRLPDILFVIGTSCKVAGIKKWIKTLATQMHKHGMQDNAQKSDSPAPEKSKSKQPQTKLDSYYKQRKSSPVGDEEPLERKMQAHQLLDPRKKRWVIYLNRTPLEQKEWASVFDLQIISDCDDVVVALQGALQKIKKHTEDENSPPDNRQKKEK
jgi:NAD-dependent SIR2 family protein deacetylase